MTERVKYLIVALEENMGTDDAQALIFAIRQMRNVASVAPEMETPADWAAHARARRKLAGKIMDILFPPESA